MPIAYTTNQMQAVSRTDRLSNQGHKTNHVRPERLIRYGIGNKKNLKTSQVLNPTDRTVAGMSCNLQDLFFKTVL